MKNLWEQIKEGIVQWFNSLTPEEYISFGGKVLKIILILVAARILIKIANYVVKGFFEKQTGGRFKMDERKAKTLSALTQSVIFYLGYFIAVVIVLQEMGLKTDSIIATAGIGGLAIGFGAQNLVKDVITGFFILFEDQYGVGDFISIDDITGTVEEIGLRITKIRGFKGDLNIIPNGQIGKVTNFSRGNSLAIVDMSIAYEMDINQAMDVMTRVALDYAEENSEIVEEPQVLGVMNLGDSDVSLRLIARTLPMKHWGVERELRKRIKEAFDQNDIEIPYPRRVVIQNNGE